MALSEPDDTNASVVTRGKIWEPVITDPTADHFAGATHGSNNTGELTAVVESFRWVLGRVEKEDKRSVLVRYDSTYAAMVAQGVWQPGSNCDLAVSAHKLYLEILETRPVFFSHVKGHSNHKWNDVADELANKGRESSSRERWVQKDRIVSAKNQQRQWRLDRCNRLQFQFVLQYFLPLYPHTDEDDDDNNINNSNNNIINSSDSSDDNSSDSDDENDNNNNNNSSYDPSEFGFDLL